MNPEVSEFFQRLNTYSARRVYDVAYDAGGTPPIAGVCRLERFQIGRSLANAVRELEGCSSRLLPFTKNPLRDRISGLQYELNKTAIRIAVVGQIKAGKTSVINVLSGRSEYLPTHVNPWTAVPTKLYFGVKGQPDRGAYFEFFSSAEWERLGNVVVAPVADKAASRSGDSSQNKAMVDWRRAALRIGDQFEHLLGYSHRYERISPRGLANYLCAGPSINEQSRDVQAGRYADITKVANVYLPLAPFAWPTILIDTPGLNDPSFIRLKTTENILEEADIYIVILSANQPMSQADITLLRRLRKLDKRRLLVFINRADELSGSEADKIVRQHVEDRLHKEFPNAAISVQSGSAYWANIAMAGTDEEVSKLANSNEVQRLSQSDSAVNAREANSLREQTFEASGFPGLIETLSELMQDSFFASHGTNLTETLKSSVDLTLSHARRELALLRSMSEPSSVNDSLAFTQVERGLQETRAVHAHINQVINVAHQQICNILKMENKALRSGLERMVLDYTGQQKMLLNRAVNDRKSGSWHCDTTSLLSDLEREFLRRFDIALGQIASSHEQCIKQVVSRLETTQSQKHNEFARLPKKAPPNISLYLPATGRVIKIDLEMPWWTGMLGGLKRPARKSDELRLKIAEMILPVAMRLVLLAEKELQAHADHARATVLEAVGTNIESTASRLSKLKDRLSGQVESPSPNQGFDRDYERNMEELTSLIATCEPVAVRLARI